jgi:putative tricarboxylic transport membrane protein
MRSAVLVALLVLSALLLEPLGFGLAMFTLTGGVAWLFGSSWRAALIGGGLQAALWYFVFGYLLEVYLPSGAIFSGLGG